jgi:hypothetical protein
MTATTLLETALNGMGLGTKISDIDQMYADHKGNKLAQAILLDLSMALEDLRRAESQQAAVAKSLRTALERFEANPTVSNAEWLAQYGQKIERHAREAQTEYQRIGKTWRMWVAASEQV